MKSLTVFASACVVSVAVLNGSQATDVRPNSDLQLAFSRHTLSNGLRVIIREDHSTPRVTSALSVGSGSRDEEPGKTGLAHLVEHALAAHIMTSDRYRNLIAAASVGLGAQTGKEQTNYPLDFPPEQVDFGLFLQSLLFAPVPITASELEIARREVLSERSQMWSHPNQAFVARLESLAFTGTGYAHDALGEEPDLKRATIDDVVRFIDQHYRPDNVAVALVGDVSTADALAILERRLGSIPARASARRVDRQVPPNRSETRVVMRDSRLSATMIGVAYSAPAYLSDDYYAVNVLAVLLGRRARMSPNKLVSGLAAGDRRQCGANMLGMGLSVEAADSSSAAEAEKAVLAQVKLAATEPAGAADLEYAKRAVEMQQLEYFETPGRLAAYLVTRELCTGDPFVVNTHVGRIGAVSADDVMRAAKRYLVPEKRSIVIALPEADVAVKSQKGEL